MMPKTTEKKSKDTAARLKDILSVLSRYELTHGITPEKLRHILEDLGPTFIKIGQVMSMRPDMIPMEYCEELMLLRTEVKPMDFADVKAVLEGELGEGWESFFSFLEEKPIGSASIAQVHKAALKDGKRVAVKVQRPGIYEKMAQDVRLFHKVSGAVKIITGTKKVIDLNAVIDEIWATARQEMDFLLEADYIKQFTEANAGIKYIAFPNVEWDLTSSKVLVMEDVGGVRIDNTEELKEQGYDLKEISAKLAENFVKQVLDDGFFHADPHPGNIYIRDGKIIWIDLGMTGRLSGRDKQLFSSAISAVAEGDINGLKNIILTIGIHRETIDHARLYSDIEEMLGKYASLELGQFDVGQVIKDFLGVADLNGISMPPNIAMLMRGIITIEGVLSNIDPEINFLQIVANHLAESEFKDINISDELMRSGKQLYRFGKSAIGIPPLVSNLLKMAARSQVKLNVEYTQPDRQWSKWRLITDRLILCLLCCSAFIGSSLLCLTKLPVCFAGVPLVSFLGFCVSVLIFFYFIFGMINNKR